jgi:cell division protein FtsN
MAKEYGRRSSHKNNGVAKQFLVILVTFLLGYLSASIWDINTLSHWLNT